MDGHAMLVAVVGEKEKLRKQPTNKAGPNKEQ